MPKVSVIIPVYNVEKYLRECLDSVVNQTLKDIEIICVDDGSTDNSLSILKEYADKDNRIKIIDKENGGYGKAMNVGLDKATGEYIGIVEPDDYIKLNMYETLYDIAIEKNLDLIKADFYRFTGSGESFEKFYAKLDSTNQYYNKVLNPSENLGVFSLIMMNWSGIYKRNFIEKYHIRHNETPGASYQDTGFWFQTFTQAERVYFLNKPFYVNRRDNENSSVFNNNKEKVYASVHEYDFIWKFLCNNPKLKNTFRGVYFLKRFQNNIWNYRRIDNSLKIEFLDFFSKEYKEYYEKNLLDLNLFSKNEKADLMMIINNPKKYYKKSFKKRSFLETIFSIKNRDGYKYLTILGIPIKIKKAKKTKWGIRVEK